MDALISVIIPIYKVEHYLEQCIDSIVNQSYKKLEIILVDDGSPDRCGQICDRYAKEDDRIIVIHKENGGLSDARNAGLEVCKGDYIVFVDSDDWMSIDGIEKLYALACDKNADLVIGGVEKFEDETGKMIWSTQVEELQEKVFVDVEEAMKDMFLYGCASWARLYKRAVHINVRFPRGEINEDEAIVLEVLNQCKIIAKTNRVVYKYRYRSNSITSTKWNRRKLDWCEHCKKNHIYIREKYPELIRYAEYRYCTSIIWALNNMTYDTKEHAGEIKQLRKELKNIFCNVVKMGLLKKKEQIRAIMLIYCYQFYAWYVVKTKRQYT